MGSNPTSASGGRLFSVEPTVWTCWQRAIPRATTSCGGAATDEIEQNLGDAVSALTYDSASGQYTYKWKTTTAMEGILR